MVKAVKGEMFSQNGLYSQKTPQEQMMQQRQDAFFGAQAQSGGQMVPPAPQHVQMGMGTNPFGNAAGAVRSTLSQT